MPLPDTTLSLGPLTNPGESEPTIPKAAMLVRLTSAAIDAISALSEGSNRPRMEFEFGDKPGLTIDGTFYPMRTQKEETSHEIYLRMQSATKPGAPAALKLYANVTDKLFVEQSEPGRELKDKIRGKTLEAAKQRDDRKTKFIEAPPAPPAKLAKKRKEPTMFRNAIRPSDQAMLDTVTPRGVSPSLPPKKKQPDLAIRKRLIHWMAVQARTRDLLAKVPSTSDSNSRREVTDLLNEVGIPSALQKGEDEANRTWTLKDELWLELRPWESPNLPDKLRPLIARAGQRKLSSMGYKTTDPEWSFFADVPDPNDLPPPPSAGPSRPTTNGSTSGVRQQTKIDVVAKNGISSKDVKRPKPKPDPKAEIPMKDESAKVAPRVSNVSGKVKEGAAPTSPTTATRKLPGSVYRAGKTTTQDPDDSTTRVKVDNKDAKMSRPSLPPKAVASAPKASQKERTGANAAAAQRIKKVRESDAALAKVEGIAERRVSDVSTLKRRQAAREGYGSDASTSLAAPQKKRKVENGTAVASSSTNDPRPRDHALPKKPEAPAPPRQKVHKNLSPLPQPPPLPKINKKTTTVSRPMTTPNESKKSTNESTSSTQSLHEARGRGENNVTGKRRRGSAPIYTSSEDESESRKTRRDPPRAASPAPPTPNANKNASAQPRPRMRERNREPRPLPTDHAGLRMRYTVTYGQCMAALSTLLAQKSRIDNMLRNGETGSVTDSDGDGELMDAEELKKLSSDYERMHEELETIRQKFSEPVQ